MIELGRHFFAAQTPKLGPGQKRHEPGCCQRCGMPADDAVHLEPTSDRTARTFFGWYVREPREREALGLPTGLVAEGKLSARAQRRLERRSNWRLGLWDEDSA